MGTKHDILSTFAIIQNMIDSMNESFFLKKYEMIPSLNKMGFVWICPDKTGQWDALREMLNTAEKEIHNCFCIWRYNVTENDLKEIEKTANTFKSKEIVADGVSWYTYTAFTVGIVVDMLSNVKDKGRRDILEKLLNALVDIHDYIDVPADFEQKLESSTEILETFTESVIK